MLTLKQIINNFFGINLYLLFKSLYVFGYSSQKLYNNSKKYKLNNIDYQNIFLFIENTYIINTKLKDKIYIDIRNLKLLNGYKGSRHFYKLPVHGQRTRTNSRTNRIK